MSTEQVVFRISKGAKTLGTGFAFYEGCRILTAAHVVEGVDRVFVRSADRCTIGGATVIQRGISIDCDASDWAALEFDDEDEIPAVLWRVEARVGDSWTMPAFVNGNREMTTLSGKITAINEHFLRLTSIQHSVLREGLKGASGAPILVNRGVAGILIAAHQDDLPLGIVKAIRIDAIPDLAPQRTAAIARIPEVINRPTTPFDTEVPPWWDDF